MEALNTEMLLISADPPVKSKRFAEKMKVPGTWKLLADEDHALADRYGVAIARKHPKALSYQDGFIQPAVFGFRGEEEAFTFVQKPSMLNLWGAARRPEPRQVLERLQAAAGQGGARTP